MLVQTLRRLAARNNGETPIYLIASERHAARARGDLTAIDLAGGGAIFEPTGRNTAAAVAIATLQTIKAYGDEIVLVVPSDHEISPQRQFWETIELGVEAAKAGRVVVFGIRPITPNTSYGYIEAGADNGGVTDVTRFVEKPDLKTAEGYLAAGNFFWNTGIFLFKASAMREAFLKHQPEIWDKAEAAFKAAISDLSGVYMPLDAYRAIPSNSIDYAIIERVDDIVMVPTGFRWNDLGSWQSMLDISPLDKDGNVIVGDVVAIDCENSYLRGEGRLLSAIGLKNVAVISTSDATFVAPVSHSQNVKKIVEHLEKSGRLETKFTPAHGRVLVNGAWRRRVQHWLMEETLPLWSTVGVDEQFGGFHEALDFDARPLAKPKRVRTMARQVYAFAVAKQRGWNGNVDRLIDHGIRFIADKGRTERGGWVRALNPDGSVLEPVEDIYDHACVLLALAHAHHVGNTEALNLAKETFVFLDQHLEDERMSGFIESPNGDGARRSNPYMHLLEAFLAWYSVVGDRAYLRRAARIINLFRSHFFEADSWTLGELFDHDWRPAPGEKGQWTEPGHHFEWASLLVEFADKSGQKDLISFARKLYASAVANGLNRATELAYGAVSRQGLPLDRISRSWPQTEAIKAAVALDDTGGPDLKPEIEIRVGRLFHWHIDPAPQGLWIDQIDDRGRSLAKEVPASIFYHLVTALTQYLDKTEDILS